MSDATSWCSFGWAEVVGARTGAASTSWPARSPTTAASSRRAPTSPPAGRGASFLKLMGASLALAAGCDRDRPEQILPYSVSPRRRAPGVPKLLRDAHAARRLRHLVCSPRATTGGRPRSRATPSIRRALARPALWQQAHVLGALRSGSRAAGAARRRAGVVGALVRAAAAAAQRWRRRTADPRSSRPARRRRIGSSRACARYTRG